MSRQQADKPFADDEVYGPEASASGNNAYYHRCEEVGHHAPFAACLNKIEERKAGRLPSVYAACSAAIGQRRCPAIDMRQQETAAGKAMFFVNRKKMLEYMGAAEAVQSQEFRPSWTRPAKASKTSKHRAEPIPSPVKQVQTDGSIYADAINAALRQATTASAPAPATMTQSQMSDKEPSLAVMPNVMTPLQLARLAAARLQAKA